ncbi:MAG: hypothetical protein IKC02_03265, partial [Oscillospiraceae bacterium]|nr:hypothetical protein [Oscillospiraceae bacterium]
GRWLGFSRDGGIVCVVSDGHILFVPAKRIWKVVALRKHAGGMFLAIDRSSYAARREVIKFDLPPSLETPQVRIAETHRAT